MEDFYGANKTQGSGKTHFLFVLKPALPFPHGKDRLMGPLAPEIQEDRHSASLAPIEVQTRDLLKLPRIERIEIKADKVKSGRVITIEC